MKRFLILLLFPLALPIHAQQNFSLRYFGFTIHPLGDDQAGLQPHKLDPKAHFVLNYGGFAGYEKYILGDMLSLKLMQGIQADCSAGISGFTHFGIRALMLDRNKNRLLLGFGPLFYFRRDWNRFPEYIDSGFFRRYHSRNFGEFQYKMFWYGFEFEYDRQLNDHWDLNIGFTPGAPLAMCFSFGVKYWPNRDFPEPKKDRIYVPKKKKKQDD